MTRSYDEIGPAVGDMFPDVVLADQRGSTVDLHRWRGSRPSIVVFHRSARW